MKTNLSIIALSGKIVRKLLILLFLLISSFLYAQFKNSGNVIKAGGALLGGILKDTKNKNAVHQTNNALVKDTAAVLNFNDKPANQFTSSSIDDISGTWEGEESNGNLIMYYKLALVHLNNNTYSGYDYCLWVKNIDHKPINTNSGMMPNAKKSFLGTFNNSELSFTEIQALENSKWGLVSEKFKFVDDNGSPAIINDNNQGARKLYLKRTGTSFPQSELNNVINENSLQIINPVFKNSNHEALLEYNDHGQLILSVKNTSGIDLNNVKGQITTTETKNGILDYDKLYGTFNIQKNTETSLPLNINTGYSVPSGQEHFNIVFTYNNMTLAQKTIEVPTKSFYKTVTFTSPGYSSPRMQAIGGYYGLSNISYSDVSKKLEPLIASGDKMASMWKAVFLSTGRGQYKLDENSAYNIGKNNLKFVEEKARNGDVEALYLLFYASQIGLEGETAKALSYDFLAKSASTGFMPAVYDASWNDSKQKDYSTAFQSFQKLYNDGVKKAANIIGMMYEQGFGVNKDVATAIEWYKKGIAFGDPEAMLSMANIYSKGFENTPPDALKGISLATQSAAKNCPDAMVFLGRKYVDGKQGVQKNIATALKWFKQGADLGDRKAMLALGEVYISNEAGITKDEQLGLFYIKKAAELGSPKAMMLLWGIYSKGTMGSTDVIAARYWYNQAVINGYAAQDATGRNAQAQTFLDFMDNADFSPSYVYVDEYGDEVGDSGDGLLNGMFSGVLSSCFGYYGNQQQLIDGLEYLYMKNGNKIYGGTVSSNFVSNLYLKQGQIVYIQSYGTVSTGMFSGLATADGLGNSWQEYALIKGIPCSAVMAEIKDGNWQFIGQKNSFTADKDGPFVFALNGIDYRNYKGYFDIVVEVSEN